MTTAAERALSLVRFMRVDEQSDAVLDTLITAWMTGVERSAEVAYGNDSADEPWTVLSDPLTAPAWALPHAALYTGGVMPPRLAGEDDATYTARARAEIVSPRGMWRGSWGALAMRMQALLTGTKYVSIVEWVDGSPWQLAARVIATEVVDVDALYAVANADDAIPAGMHITIVQSSGAVWDEVAGSWDATLTTWDAT